MASTSVLRLREEDDEDNYTTKLYNFVTLPLRDRSVQDVPGVGPDTAKRLKNQDFTERILEHVLLACYIGFEKNEKKFKKHLLKDLGVEEVHFDVIFTIVRRCNDSGLRQETDDDSSIKAISPEAADAVKKSLEKKKTLPAYVLFGRYLAFDKDAYNFKGWLKCLGVRPSYRRRIVSALKEWHMVATVVPPGSSETLLQYVQGCFFVARFISVERNLDIFRKYLGNQGYEESHQKNVINAMKDFCFNKHKTFDETSIQDKNVRCIPGIDDITAELLRKNFKEGDLPAYVLLGCYIAFERDDDKFRRYLQDVGIQSETVDIVITALKGWDFATDPVKYTLARQIEGFTARRLKEKITKIILPAHVLLGLYADFKKEDQKVREYLQKLAFGSNIVDAVINALKDWDPTTDPVKYRVVTDISGIDDATASLLFDKITKKKLVEYFRLGCSAAFKDNNAKFREYLKTLGVHGDKVDAFSLGDFATEYVKGGVSKSNTAKANLAAQRIWDEIPKINIPAYALLGRYVVWGSFKQWLTKLKCQRSSVNEIFNALTGWCDHHSLLLISDAQEDEPMAH
ncbi:uncharacterized protein LOC112569206 [Pomacea canaliculata]|uniref:uncharacterized protein LOC112569206 n=1 Tax=Pomacea canaliculata TaxID=400727 RepID=UPI000D73AA70|nr:uncharacterized protein LOC112569206 [Pomacea canaliculata]